MKRAGAVFFLISFFLVLNIGSGRAEALTYQADETPWSGWWWPFAQGGLVTGTGYDGHPAPLEKYDLVTSGVTRGPATLYGLSNYYNTKAESWEGMCFCWAAAAMLEEEPVHRGIFGGLLFNVGDKKGILTAAYDGTLYDLYPIDNPEDFQEILETFIGNRRSMIMMDLGTDGEIWNYPVYKYDIDYTEAGNIRHYTVTIYFASDTVAPDYVGMRESSRTYYYYYELSGSVITGSGWESGSESAHPVSAADPYGTACTNPGLDYNRVREIVYTDDDPYEPNDDFDSAASLTSGGYLLIAANNDYFQVDLRTGDRLKIRVDMESPGVVEVNVYDPARALIGRVCDGCTTTKEALMAGEYVIEVVPSDPSSEPVYELHLEQELSFRGVFPNDPSGVWSGGVTLTGDGEALGRVILCQTDEEGNPERSYSVEVEGSCLEGLLETFGLTPSLGGYIRVDSDRPLAGMYSATDGSDLLMGCNLVPLSRAYRKIVFSHIASVSGWNTYFGFMNLGDTSEELDLTVYDSSGGTVSSERWVLDSGEKVEDDRFTGLFPSRGASVAISTRSGNDALVGYLVYQAPLTSKARALLAVDGPQASELNVPHVAATGAWWTGISVMNGGTGSADVGFSAYDSGGALLGTVYRTLAPNQTVVSMAAYLFTGVSPDRIASLKVTAGTGAQLAGLAVYGSRDGQALSAAPMASSFPATLYAPWWWVSDTWWEGLAVVQKGTEQKTVVFDLMDDAGTVLQRVTRLLEPQERFIAMAETLFGTPVPDAAKTIRVYGGETPLSGIYILGSRDGKRLCGDILPGIVP
jgi:hypothetical protein